MIGIAKNYDGLCYHLKVVHKNLDHPQKKKLDSFLEEIKTDLMGVDEFSNGFIEKRFPSILWLRLFALKQKEIQQYSLTQLLDNEAYPYFERMAENGRLAILAENILFALRCNKKVLKALSKRNLENEGSLDASFVLPEISYEQLIGSIRLGAPNAGAAETLIEWINCSFQIEYVILAASVINDEILLVPHKKIEKLAAIVADAAQTYSAIAAELGIFSLTKAAASVLDTVGETDVLVREKKLAETGIDLFAQNWKD